MKTFYEFIEDEKIQSKNSEINEVVGPILTGIASRIGPIIGAGSKLLRSGAAAGKKALGDADKYVTGAGIGSTIAGKAIDSFSKSILDADNEDEVEEILNNKIKEAEKLLKSKLETHFKNFSVNLTINLNKIIKTNMDEFKKKIDTALTDFMA